MDAVSYSLASKQAQRIEKFIENPDSTSGIVTVPKTIASGETVTVPAGRVAVLPNVVVDGTLNIDGEVFIPSGSSVDFSNGIKIDGENIALSIPTSYHLLEGNLSVSNEVITNGFSTTLYTGNGSTQSINTGIDMNTQWGNDASEMFGGLVWGKSINVIGSNWFTDTVRGNTKKVYSNLTQAEYIDNTGNTGFTSTGFNLGLSGDGNANTVTYASWNFQTTHRRTGVTNHGKAYTEHYNPFTGFTIIKYEGSGLAGHEIPHSLGRELRFKTIKSLGTVQNWICNQNGDYGNVLILNTTNTLVSNSTGIYINSDNGIKVSVGSDVTVNSSTVQYIMYGWANSYLDESNKLIGNYEVGVYQGTGVAGNKVTTKCKPAWVMIKRLDAVGDWVIMDNIRTPFGTNRLFPQSSSAEVTIGSILTGLSGGFRLDTADTFSNASGGQYLYMVVYDNDSGSGKSKYPKATDTSNVQINNAIIPLAHGVDSNGSKNSIVIANETVTGLTYTQGKNYLYKTDTGYGVKPYEPRYLSSELVRRYAGEQPDYYDVNSNKWFNTDTGSELVTNGTFSSGVTTGWTAVASTLSIVNNTIRVTSNSAAYGQANLEIATVIGKKYKATFKINAKSNTQAGVYIDSLSGVASNGILVNTGVIANVGTYSLEFIAQTTTTYIKLVAENVSGYWAQFDDISVFPVDITPTTEITESRNYLNHIVHADQNGQAVYVEELPKIEYKDIVKANEFKGKNACTAWAYVDNSGSTPYIKDGVGFSYVIRTATGVCELYPEVAFLDINYGGKITQNAGGMCNLSSTRYLNKVVATTRDTSGVSINCNFTVEIKGGRN